MSDNTREKNAWTPFLRQLLVASVVWSNYFMLGLCMGAPTVFIPQIRREANSTDAISGEMASWLSAVLSYSGIPWIFILAIAITFIGRKISYSITCVTSIIGFIVLYFSENVYHILAAEIIHSVLTGSYFTISVIIITEYSSSKYRGIFMTIKSATFFWGVLVANTIGTFFHWKNIALLGFSCSIYCMVSLLFWPESPIWLASKRKFDECAKSHRWIKGSDMESERELQRLLSEYENINVKNVSLKSRLIHLFKTLGSRDFVKPILYCLLILTLYMCSGKMVCTIYAIDILKKITNNEKSVYMSMLILDGITVISMYVGCIICKLLRRRTLLLISSSIYIIFLLLTSLYLYLAKLEVVEENKYISIFLLMGFSISVSCGPMIMSSTISGELVPLHSRSLSICTVAVLFKLMYGTFIKLAPYCFRAIGLHGTFLGFGISSSICLVLVYIYLPETKDKTLQEINDIVTGKTEEVKELIPFRKKIQVVASK